MKFKQLQHWLCENLPLFSTVTFFTLQKRTQRFPGSEWQDLSPASKLPRGIRNNYYTKSWGYNWTDFFEDVLAFALCDSNGIVRGSRCNGWVGYCGVLCRFGTGSLRTGELCYVYYRRFLLMLTCRASVSEGKQLETVFDEGRNYSLRTRLHNFNAVNKFKPACFYTVKSENVQFVTIRSYLICPLKFHWFKLMHRFI